MSEPTPVQLQILRQRYPMIGEPALRRNWALLLAGHTLNPPKTSTSGQFDKKADLPVRKKTPSSPSARRWLTPIDRAFFETHGILLPTPEYRFAPPRRWRFDFAWPDHKVALEVEGGVWTEGRHTRGAGFLGDMEKYNEAACLGWRIVRVTPDDLRTAKTATMIKRILP